MGSDFITKIGEIAEVFDGPHATPKKIDTGPYFLSISSLENGQLDLSKSAHLSEEQFVKWTKRVTPREGDVLFSYETRLGEAALMPGGVKACLGRRMGLLRPNLNKVLPEYLLYAYLSPAFQSEIKKRTNHGATVERISLKELPDFEVRIPALNEQKSTVKILKALNEKIALNNQINQTLEQMAQTLFKSWFVDFDPVIDNALDAGNPIPEVFETRVERRKYVRESADFKPLPDDVRQLFPSEFEESELGWVPKGWRGETFNDIFDIASSKRVFAKDYVDSGVPFYRGKEITELSQGKAVNTEIFISEEKYQELKDKSGAPKAGDILITSVGTIGNTYLVREGDKFYFKDGNLTWIRGYKKERIPFFIKEWFKTSHAKDAIERVKIGTTQQAITIKALNNIVVLLPSSKILSFYENYLSNTYSKHSANLDENAYLEKLRDTLLPKLISGELRLDSPEVEQAKALVD
ncbi:restriction endonuclease subunit S [Vibrio rotiferianus]|uniref:restriction endonuclease subunit S n=1 Tax=Vibrio rotiferianus TaxID=190895 RepID=UPI00390A5637